MFCILDKLHSSLISICIETKIWRPLATLTYCAHLWVRRVPKKAVETNLTLVEHSGSRDAAQILFQMDHCPAMFDNCHRYQYDGPLKMGKQNSTKYRAQWQNPKSNVTWYQSLLPCDPKLAKPATVSVVPFKKTDPHLCHWPDPTWSRDSQWWIYAAFFASRCHETRCIYADGAVVDQMYRCRRAQNESLAPPPCEHCRYV